MQKLEKFLLTSLLVSAATIAAAAPTGYSINADGPDDNHDSLYRIDLATGAETRIGRVTSLGVTRNDVEGLAFAPDGVLYGVDDEVMTLFPLNPDNGVIQTADEVNISGLPFGGQNDFGMTFACDGSLFVTSVTRRALYRLDLEGEATRIGAEGALGANISAIAAFGDNPVNLYGLGNGLDGNLQEDTPSLFRIDVTTGVATEIGPLGASADAYAEGGLAFDDSGQLWAITDRRDAQGFPLPGQVMKIDLATGAASDVRTTGTAGFESLAITVPRGCQGSVGDSASFKVQKLFMDNNQDLASTLNISCNAGLPLQQSITTQPGDGIEVTFSVTNFTDGQLDCDIWETTSDEYFATYECFSTGECQSGTTMCTFTNASAGQDNLCVIRNYPEAAEVGIVVEWDLGDGDIEAVDDAVTVELFCRNIVGGDGEWTFGGMRWAWDIQYTPPASEPDPEEPASPYDAVANVQPRADGTSECRVESQPAVSAIETTSNCTDWQPVIADGATLVCTVTNTYFFEGIPALGRGGLLLTILLVLGTGLVFVRRF